MRNPQEELRAFVGRASTAVLQLIVLAGVCGGEQQPSSMTGTPSASTESQKETSADKQPQTRTQEDPPAEI